MEKVARDIQEEGGRAETAVVDALDEEQVDAFVDRVAKKNKKIDISFNLISFGDIQQPLMDIDVNDFTKLDHPGHAHPLHHHPGPRRRT